ncbi:707_t:CDS:2, partial [Racocetra persica]
NDKIAPQSKPRCQQRRQQATNEATEVSSYRKLSQLELIFGICMKRIDELELYQLGSIDGCNETERFVTLCGAISTLGKIKNGILHREWFLSGINNKGKLDYTIKKDENIFCTIEAKMTNIEQGFCQNLVQLQCACE